MENTQNALFNWFLYFDIFEKKDFFFKFHMGGQGNIFIFKVQMLVTSISELNVWNLALSDVAAIFGSDLENKKLDSDFE